MPCSCSRVRDQTNCSLFSFQVHRGEMGARNQSTVTEFIIAGFPGIQHIESILFMLLLFTYLLIITGNVVIFLAIRLQPRLHAPMYFFISILSFLELWYTAVTIPKMLSNLLDARRSISFKGCLMQTYFFHALGITEILLLTSMAYDRYLAICIPLHYPTIMTSTFGVQLATSCWLGGFLYPLPEIILISRLPFCGPNIIDHIFCDLPPLLSLACTDTSLSVFVDFMLNAFVLLGPLMFILLTYIMIIRAVLRIQSSEGRKKAFSTCASHLIVVVMFFSTTSFMYIRLTKTYSLAYDRLLSVVYSVLTPLLNPVIYSLRNKEIRDAVWKMLKGRQLFF
ncbi:olfactory receptor 6N1-like [Rhinatrema bivittatum]|uniref:olfactory receptor 6N1-like n=1 Tax=Rhinatrema bivittatum TaxID=194408 RepID=UPI00112C195F|nr:olfactory receptor 6N1-like [Rhinatrema bivittatum]